MKFFLVVLVVSLLLGCYASFVAKQSYGISTQVNLSDVKRHLVGNGYSVCENSNDCYYGRYIDSFIIRKSDDGFTVITSTVHLTRREGVEREFSELNAVLSQLEGFVVLCNENSIIWGVETVERRCKSL